MGATLALSLLVCCHLSEGAADYDVPHPGYYSADYDYSDTIDTELPLQQKREWYKRNDHKRWPICTTYSKSCNISPRSCCKGFVCMCNLWGQNCRCKRQGVLSQWFG